MVNNLFMIAHVIGKIILSLNIQSTKTVYLWVSNVGSTVLVLVAKKSSMKFYLDEFGN